MFLQHRPTTVNLTARETEVVNLVGSGLSSKQVAARLGIAPRTVEAYIEHVRLKLGATTGATWWRWPSPTV